MSLIKFAHFDVLSVERGLDTVANFVKSAHRADFSHIERRPGFIYVRSRAISSRCNDNFDEFPAEEIKAAYNTFLGRPCFVNHKNSNHRRARGVIVATALHEDTNPDGTPDTWAEVLMEIDAVRFPVLAREVIRGNIARTSMGTDVKYSVCTACGNKAYTPADYCQHIPKMKGMKIQRKNAATGHNEEVLIAERCYGLNFFENSLLVEPPADPTAFVLGVDGEGVQKAASLSTEAVGCVVCANPGMKFTAQTDPLCHTHQFLAGEGYDWGSHNFPESISTRSGLQSSAAEGDNPRERTCTNQRCLDYGTHVPDDHEHWIIGTSGKVAFPSTLSQPRRRRGSAVSVLLAEATNAGDPLSDYNTLDGCTICGDSEHSTEDHLAHPEIWNDVNRRSVGVWAEAGSYTDSQEQRDFYKARENVTYTDGTRVQAGDRIRYHQAPGGLLSPPRGIDGDFDWKYGVAEWVPANSTGNIKQLVLHADDGYYYNLFGHVIERADKTAGKMQASVQSAARTKQVVKASEVRAGDRLDIGGKTRIDLVHPNPPEGKVLARTQTSGTRSPSVRRWDKDEDVTIWREGAAVQRIASQVKVTPDMLVHRPNPIDIIQNRMLRTLAYGEVKAPAAIDTMRAEACPVCGDDEGFNGERCNVCGYTQPPEQFRDPDLSKAKEVDLRQEQQADQSALGPEAPVEAEAPQGDLKCTNCGEVFSAEGDAATGTDATDPAAQTQADPEHPDDTEDIDREKVGRPEDPDDLADLDDEDDEEADLALEDEAEDPDEEVDPEVAPDPNPAASGEGRVTPEGDEDQIVDPSEIQPNSPCPVCGMGTLVPVAVPEDEQSLDEEEDPTGIPPKKTPKNSSRQSAGSVQKEASTDMNQPNPAQQRRSKIVAAIREQQGVIEEQHRTLASQHQQIRALTDAVATLAVAAGAGRHPVFSGLVRSAGLTHLADSAQNPEGAPATTTEEAKKPQATDDPNNVGAAPGEANKDVTPAATTDVNNSNVAANPPVLDNLQDVTKPVAGTDAPTPAAGDAAGTSTVTVGTPSQESFDSKGPQWTAAMGTEKERFVASVRLARLQIKAGLEAEEDMVVAERIASSDMTLDSINASVETLSKVQAKQASQVEVQQQRTRGLVPQAARRTAGIQPLAHPSMQAQASEIPQQRDDEWAFGADTV